MKNTILIILILVSTSLWANDKPLPSCASLRGSSTIKTNQTLVKQLQAAMRKHALSQEQRQFCYEQPQETTRTLWSDSAGHPRVYTSEGGSDDHAERKTGYYDEHGELRSLYIKINDVHGNEDGATIEYDASGNIICRTVSERLRATDLDATELPFHNPKQAFADKAPSREIPAGQKEGNFCRK